MSYDRRPGRAAAGAMLLLSVPVQGLAAPAEIGFRFPDWPVAPLIEIVDDNRGLRDLLVLDRETALRAIQRLLMPPSYAPGDEAGCAPQAPPAGAMISVGTEGPRVCAVVQVMETLRQNRALADLLHAEPDVAGLFLTRVFEPPIEDRQAPVQPAPPPPDDPRAVATLMANPALEQIYQTSPEAVLSIIEMLRLAAAAQ